MPGLGMFELLFLLVIGLLFFGAGRFSSLGKILGRCVSSFRQGAQDAEAIDITPLDQKRSD